MYTHLLDKDSLNQSMMILYLEPKNGEDDDSGKDRGETVGERHNKSISK